MSRKRTPEAVLIGEGDVLVKHCDDLETATALARAVVAKSEYIEDPDEAAALWLPEGRVIWCRILGALPNSWAAAEGYAWHYERASGPARGVFRAVEFLR